MTAHRFRNRPVPLLDRLIDARREEKLRQMVAEVVRTDTAGNRDDAKLALFFARFKRAEIEMVIDDVLQAAQQEIVAKVMSNG